VIDRGSSSRLTHSALLTILSTHLLACFDPERESSSVPKSLLGRRCRGGCHVLQERLLFIVCCWLHGHHRRISFLHEKTLHLPLGSCLGSWRAQGDSWAALQMRRTQRHSSVHIESIHNCGGAVISRRYKHFHVLQAFITLRKVVTE